MVFLGCLFDREEEKKILDNSKCGLMNAVNTFQWNLIDGINKILEKPLCIINVLPVGTFPRAYKKLILKTKTWSYDNSKNTEIGSINLPFLKQWIREHKIKKILKKSSDKEIIIYSTYLPFLRAIKGLDKSWHISLIVPDLPEYYDYEKPSVVRKVLRNINNKLIYKCLDRVDSFVLFTEHMKEPLKVGNRPYTIVEGVAFAQPEAESIDNENGKKVIMYAGAFHYKYGVKTLVDAFSMIEDKNYELWLCGTGEAKAEVENAAKSDKRIKYYGYCTKQYVNELQKKATVLINPRPNEGEYNKYTFPSKTMEYLAAGKPVIMYKLDGIPDEYDNYLYYINGSSAEDLKNTIMDVCSKTDEELAHFGAKASKWVLKEKSPAGQAKKIIRMINNERI